MKIIDAIEENLFNPCLQMNELVEITGMSNANIGMHEKRGNLSSRGRQCRGAHGRGVKILYTIGYLAELLALRQLLLGGQPLRDAGGPHAFFMGGAILRGMFPGQLSSSYSIICTLEDGSSRSISADCPDPREDLSWLCAPDEDPPQQILSWWVMDNMAMAKKLISIMEKYAHVFSR